MLIRPRNLLFFRKKKTLCALPLLPFSLLLALAIKIASRRVRVFFFLRFPRSPSSKKHARFAGGVAALQIPRNCIPRRNCRIERRKGEAGKKRRQGLPADGKKKGKEKGKTRGAKRYRPRSRYSSQTCHLISVDRDKQRANETRSNLGYRAI